MTNKAKTANTTSRLIGLLTTLFFSQTSLGDNTASLNTLRAGDRYMCFSLQGKALGSSGENCLWNFKDLKEGNAFTIEYQIVPTTIDTTWLYDNIRQLSANENYTFCNDILVHTKQNSLVYYLQKPNKQLLVGIENNLIKLDFDKPITLLHLPITYKEKSSDTFNGTLSYSENLFLKYMERAQPKLMDEGLSYCPTAK